MSTLNQAFIKAYQKQAAVPAPHFSGTAFEHKAPAEKATAFLKARKASAASDPGAANNSPLTEADAPAILAVQSERSGAAAANKPTAAVLPLLGEPSACIAEAPTAGLIAGIAASEPLRAALEVEQFDWPEAAESLRKAASDQFAAWRQQFADYRTTTLMVTSQQRGAGRTTVLLAAARHLALNCSGARIVLVDADFERPQLAPTLGVAVQTGWEDVFAGNQPLTEAMVESTADRITLVALRGAVSARKILAHSSQLTATIRALQQNFDFVCVDAGPLADAADMVQGAVFHPETGIDAALVVRDLRKPAGEENAAIGRRLAELGVGHWDLVENFVRGLA